MPLLFLHGWHSVPGGLKPLHLARHGHEVLNPALDDDDFERAVRTAQEEFDRHRPDVVVGSSRGGAVALNMDTGDAKLVLLCPAWKNWGRARTAKPGTVVLHSRGDEVIPFADSEELVRQSGLPPTALVETGSDHRLADPESLATLLSACGAASKSSVDEIRARFDGEAQLYTNLETGQVAVMDSALALGLISESAAITTPRAVDLLELGCGGGNYTLKLLERLPHLNVTLVDLSRTMLEIAESRVRPKTTGAVTTIESDVRDVELGGGRFDVVLASAVLHHLRTDVEWRAVFQKVYDALRPGGSFWIYDIVESPRPELQAIHWRRYGDYLTSVGGPTYRDELYARILDEDTPRSVPYQLDLLRTVGFEEVELLHKHACFAAFGAFKLAEPSGGY